MPGEMEPEDEMIRLTDGRQSYEMATPTHMLGLRFHWFAW